MNKLDKIQQIQEDQYRFPYHHLTDLNKGNFSLSKHLYWGHEYTSYLEFIIKRITDINFESILDVGCGDGKFLYQCNKKFANKKLVGLDYSETAINMAKALNNSINYIKGDIGDREKITEKYDIITLIEVLEHIPPKEISDFIANIKHHLNDNGQLIITVPSKNIPTTSKHYQHFDLDSIRLVISPHFEIENIYYLNKISISEKIIRRLLSNRLFILNEQRLLNLLYNLYKNKNLLGSEKNTKRICVFCKKS